MLFITNRRLREGPRSKAGRRVSFDLSDNDASACVYFCRRVEKDVYEELTAPVALRCLRRSPRRQILLYFHGYNCLPEGSVFPSAIQLQALCDRLSPKLVEVVPLVWPCDDDFGLLKDYWDDQTAAESSGIGFARALGKLLDWRDRLAPGEQCLKHINILAHSMGNRVLRSTILKWTHDFGPLAGFFRGIFMVAADVANDCLEEDKAGSSLAEAARTLVIYHANDDFALRTSKVVNLRNKVVGRRLGHSGPRRIESTPANVVAVDCDAFNGTYDPIGHTYFLADPSGTPGLLIRHMIETIATGRPASMAPGARTLVLHSGMQTMPPANDIFPPAIAS